MRPGVTVALTAVDRRRLGAIVGNRNVPQKHAWRAEIVLLTADGLGTVEIMRRTGKSKTCVWRWQESFAAEGVDGLLRDKTRPPRVPPLGQEVIDRVVALTATEPPHEATHWTGAAMAKAVDMLSFLIARDTMHQNQWIAAIAELEADGLEMTPCPSNFPEGLQHEKIASHFWNCATGTESREGGWAAGATPDGKGEFEYVENPVPLGP